MKHLIAYILLVMVIMALVMVTQQSEATEPCNHTPELLNKEVNGFGSWVVVGRLQVWFSYGAQREAFVKGQRTWTPEQWEIFDVESWKEYSDRTGAK